MNLTYLPAHQIPWEYLGGSSSAYIASTFRTLAIHEKWNEQHIVNWISRPVSETHDLSHIDYAPLNNNSGLSVTKDGNLVFSKKENKVFVITAPDDRTHRILLCKYRMMYDIYLLYESHGYKIEEYLIDECPACTCVPSSADFIHVERFREKRALLRDERTEDTLLCPRRKRGNTKTHKSREFRNHPMQADRQMKLQKQQTYATARCKRDRFRRYDRAYKISERSVWNVTEDSKVSCWTERWWDAYEESDQYRYDYGWDQNSWRDEDDVPGVDDDDGHEEEIPVEIPVEAHVTPVQDDGSQQQQQPAVEVFNSQDFAFVDGYSIFDFDLSDEGF